MVFPFSCTTLWQLSVALRRLYGRNFSGITKRNIFTTTTRIRVRRRKQSDAIPMGSPSSLVFWCFGYESYINCEAAFRLRAAVIPIEPFNFYCMGSEDTAYVTIETRTRCILPNRLWFGWLLSFSFAQGCGSKGWPRYPIRSTCVL